MRNTRYSLQQTFHNLYPFSSHYLSLDNDIRYHYLDEGKGETIIMLHGNPTWSFYYRNLAIELRKRYRVIVPDHIGCGFSDKPTSYPYHLETHIQNLSCLIDSLALDTFHLVLHDWGGPIGLGYSGRHPDKVKRMVVLNTTPSLPKKIPLRILLCKVPILGQIAIQGCNLFALGATFMACKKKMSPEIRSGYIKPYDTYQHRIANLRFVQDIPLHKTHPSWGTGEEIANNLHFLQKKPILVCWGEKDFCFTTDFLDEWITRFPHAEIHRFPDAGHYVLEDAFEDILPLVKQFLS